MKPEPISASAVNHYPWGNDCHGWHLLKSAGLSVIEERMPASSAEVRHWHARALQFFYVLEGVLTMEIEGDTHTMPANTGITIPSGNAHQAMNSGPGDVRFLVISNPPHQGDRRE